MTTRPKVLIVGAGIGGLTTAIALRQAGFGVEIFERAAELKEIGAAIGLSANAVRVLNHLGLMQRIVDQGTVVQAAVSYNSRGDTLGRLSMNVTDVPSVCLHRADLQQALLSALPPECVHLNESFVRFEQTTEGVTVHFAGGHHAPGKALIGADGLRSRVRAQLLGDGEPVYRGYQCWRGVCDRPAHEVLTETFGMGVRVGVVPIGRRGTAWWCTANEIEFARDEPDGAQAKLLSWIGNWPAPIPDVIRATDPAAILKTGIYDRRPMRTWSQGRCTLLGDAAHPTTPNMAQGAAMAIEDAVVLARCLSHYSDPGTAFRHYERLRYARTTGIARISRYAGVVGQSKHPAAAWLRNTLMRLGSGRAATKSYARFVSYDPFEIPLPGPGLASPPLY